MKKNNYVTLRFFSLTLLPAICLSFASISGNNHGGGEQELLFSAVNGTTSKPDTVLWAVSKRAAISAFELTGSGKSQFIIVAAEISQHDRSGVVVAFKPANGKVGISSAALIALGAEGDTLETIALTGLSAEGLEGENEPPLSRVFEALGYQINLGWTSLGNHCKPEMQGDELPAGTFTKAGAGPVTITPVARYSPDFKLPFGFYTNDREEPVKHQLGALALAGQYPEHQTLFPQVEGDLSFDPNNAPFGFYVSGPDHTAYSEDRWNQKYHQGNVAHATRVYQAKDKHGEIIKHAYFLCFEEASNGDYNDYVFLVENISAP